MEDNQYTSEDKSSEVAIYSEEGEVVRNEKKSRLRKPVATLSVNDYIFPNGLYYRNWINGKFLKVAPYTELNTHAEANPLFYASIKYRQAGDKLSREVGHMFVPVPSESRQSEIYHRGMSWRMQSGDAIEVTSEACMDLPNTVKKNGDMARPIMTCYAVDLGAPGANDHKYSIQERALEIRESPNPLKWLAGNGGIALGKLGNQAMRVLPFTDNEKWKEKSAEKKFRLPEFGQIFNVHGDFGIEGVDGLILDSAPLRALPTWRLVDYDLRDSDYNVYATIRTNGFARLVSGGVLPKALSSIVGDGIFDNGPIRYSAFREGLIRHTGVKIYDERLNNERFLQLSAFLADIVKADVIEGIPAKLRRSCEFDDVTVDKLMQFTA